MTMVWAAQGIEDQAELLVLLALADWSNDAGRSWPSIPTLAEKSRMSERNARYVLGRLEASGMVVISGRAGGRGKANEYQISLQLLQGLACGKAVDKQDETLQTGTGNPANGDTKPCNAIERARARYVKEPSKAEPGEAAPRKSEAIAKEKAEAAWGCFWSAWDKHTSTGVRLVISDPLANKTYHALGGRSWAMGEAGNRWPMLAGKFAFVQKAMELDLKEFMARAS